MTSRAAVGRGRTDAVTQRLRGLLLTLVLLAPLPLGANRPWAWSLLAAATGALLLGWGWQGLRGQLEAVPLSSGLRMPAALFALVVAYIVLQTVPGMPAGIAHPAWSLIAETGIGTPRDSISIAPDATLTALMRLLAYAGVFWLSLQLFGSLASAERALHAVALASGIYAAAALVFHLSGSNLILWFEKWAHEDSVTGTFTNRNHFATFTGIGLLACLAGVLRELRLGLDPDAADPAVLSGRLLGARPILPALAAAGLVDLVALMLSRSRAGVAATLIACTVLLTGVLWRAGNRRAAGFRCSPWSPRQSATAPGWGRATGRSRRRSAPTGSHPSTSGYCARTAPIWSSRWRSACRPRRRWSVPCCGSPPAAQGRSGAVAWGSCRAGRWPAPACWSACRRSSSSACRSRR